MRRIKQRYYVRVCDKSSLSRLIRCCDRKFTFTARELRGKKKSKKRDGKRATNLHRSLSRARLTRAFRDTEFCLTRVSQTRSFSAILFRDGINELTEVIINSKITLDVLERSRRVASSPTRKRRPKESPTVNVVRDRPWREGALQKFRP